MTNEIELENQIKDILTEVFKDLIINTKQTFNLFLKQEHSSDLIALYDFYYYTAKWQKTNQPKATIHYVMKGLKWGEQKVRNRKQQLVKLGLIKDVRKINNENKYLGWYIKINYIWGANTILNRVKTTLLENNRVETTLPKTTLLEKNTVVSKPTNALSDNNINALSNNKKEEKALPKNEINLLMEKFQEINPSYRKFFFRISERAAVQRLVNQHGFEAISQILAILPQTNSMQYAPVITTPSELEDKFAKLGLFIQREKVAGNNRKLIKI